MSEHRSAVLRKAESIVNGNRNATYGDPNQDFTRTGSFWGQYLAGVLDRQLDEMSVDADATFSREDVIDLVRFLIDGHDVGAMMILLKISRSCVSPGKGDHWVDLAGYAACAYDCLASDERITTKAEDVT